MINHSLELPPAALDSWLREHLARRLVMIGVTLTETTHAPQAIGVAGETPAALVAALAWYEEIWLRWLAAGTTLDALVIQAAAREADALLIWLAAPKAESGTAQPPRPAGNPPSWSERPLQRLLATIEGQSLRESCVLALLGPDASRALARRLGYDDGFGPELVAARVATALVREVAGRQEFRRSGSSSPPCYL